MNKKLSVLILYVIILLYPINLHGKSYFKNSFSSQKTEKNSIISIDTTTINLLIDSAKVDFVCGKFDEVIKLSVKAKKICEDNLSLSGLKYSESLKLISKSYIRKFQLDSAQFFSQQYLLFCSNKYGQNSLKSCEANYLLAQIKYFQEKGENYATTIERLNNLAQIAIKSDTVSLELFDIYNEIGRIYQTRTSLDTARYFFLKSNAILKEHQDIDRLIISLNNLGTTYLYSGKNLKKGIDYFNKCLLLLNEQPCKNPLKTAILYNNLGASYGQLGFLHIDTAMYYLEKSISTFDEKFGKGDPRTATPYMEIAMNYKEMGDFKSAESNFNKALSLLNTNYSQNKLEILYNYLEMNISLERFETAEKLANEIIRQSIYFNDYYKESSTYNYLGTIFINRGKLKEAVNAFNSSLEVNKTILSKGDVADEDAIVAQENIAHAYTNLASVYYLENNSKQAIDTLKIALDIWLKSPENKQKEIANIYNNLGLYYLEEKKYKEARSTFRIALERRQILYGEYHFQTANAYENFAKLEIENEDYKKALEFIQKAENSLQYISNKKPVVPLSELIDFLALKGTYNFNYFNQSDSLIYLERSLKAYDECISFIEKFRGGIPENISKQELVNKYFDIYEQALNVQYIHNKKTKKQNYEKFFRTLERSKSFILREQLYRQNISQTKKIPDSILVFEKIYINDINNLEQELYSLKNIPLSLRDDSIKLKILQVNSEILDSQKKLKGFKNNIEAYYPEYFDSKYNNKTISLAECTENLMQPKETVISYLVGNENIFAFILNLDGCEIVKIKKQFDLDDLALQLRIAIEKNLVEQFAYSSHELYKNIFHPIQSYISHDTEKITIVPDGPLSTIPFETLISEKPNASIDYRKLSYLIKKYTVVYQPSMTSLHWVKNKEIYPNKSSIVFAPFSSKVKINTIPQSRVPKFVNDSTSFPLLYATKEIASFLQGKMKADSYLNSDASKKNFMDLAKDYKIIHLATHAKADSKNGSFSYIAFNQQDSIDDELVYAYEIYNSSINAEMVVISTCESGQGQLVKGEGILSLGRAFQFAGAKSFVSSFWTVNDYATTYLMKRFYNHLNTWEYKEKDDALRDAKIEMLQGEYFNPKDWAAFMLMGDMKPLHDNSSHFLWVFLLFTSSLLGLLFFIKIKKFRKTK